MRIALVDLGTASLRFEIYEISRIFRPKCIHQERTMPRLGAGLYESSYLNPRGKEETINFFKTIPAKLSKFKVSKAMAVATSALREATDGRAFVKDLEDSCKETNLVIKIISGTDEASLIAKGIIANERNIPKKCAFIDIGGGSTEVSICIDKQIHFSISLPFGSIRFQQLYLKNSPPEQEALLKTSQFARNKITEQFELLNHAPVIDWIGTSGTVRTLQGLKSIKKDKENRFCTEDLSFFIAKISNLSISQIKEIPGIDPRRADIILAGSLILRALTESLGGRFIRASRYSLRHGLLEELMEGNN